MTVRVILQTVSREMSIIRGVRSGIVLVLRYHHRLRGKCCDLSEQCYLFYYFCSKLYHLLNMQLLPFLFHLLVHTIQKESNTDAKHDDGRRTWYTRLYHQRILGHAQ
jgi:hypothetical protein